MKFTLLLRFSVAMLVLSSVSNLTFGQLNMAFRSNLTYPFVLANIWGHVDSLGNEYALVGTNEGLSIVDVTVPATPVERFTVQGPMNSWREVRTKDKYAFVTTEGGSSGLNIVNLTYLPDSVQSKFWRGNGAINNQLSTIHALQVDGNYLYLYGSNLFNGATLIVDITDPWNPVYVNKYIMPGGGNNAYVHDGYVRNDTMYEGHIYAGLFTVVDVSDKMNPVLLATQSTPGNFTHNTWLSDNSSVLFTTDEVSNSFLTAYDISDLGNIRELSRIQSNPGSSSIVHNTHVLNDFCVTSWYKDGVVIVDGNKPDNLVIVGYYDTYIGGGTGFNGTWGVYPYLPSGNIIASDIDNGLFVFTPNYVRAAYLEGIVTDSTTGQLLNNVFVEILTTSTTKYTLPNGVYKTGLPAAGTYSVRYSKAGYYTKVISNVVLTNGIVSNLNVELACIACVQVNGVVLENGTLNPVPNARVKISNPTNSVEMITDVGGNFIMSNFISGSYEVIAGKWNYVTSCSSGQVINASSGLITILLDKGIYDDFTFDYGWTVSGSASAGIWERGVPVGTTFSGNPANPGLDVSSDCSNLCFVTGNAGGAAGNDDVDDGNTILSSPLFDAAQIIDPMLRYSRWFFNDGGAGSPNDSLKIKLTNGTTTVVLETVTSTNPTNGTWVNRLLRISDFITPTSTMQLIVETADWPAFGGHLVEAGLDAFSVLGSGTSIMKNDIQNNFTFYPNPVQAGSSITFHSGNPSGKKRIIFSDISGKIVAEHVFSETQFSISIGDEFKQGVYFVFMEHEGNLSSVSKLIIF